MTNLYLKSRLFGKNLTISFDFIPPKMKVSRDLCRFREERKRKIIAIPPSYSRSFLSRGESPERLTESLCLHTNEHTRSLIALEASLRRVFFPNFVTAAVICSRLFVHSLHRFACRCQLPSDF